MFPALHDVHQKFRTCCVQEMVRRPTKRYDTQERNRNGKLFLWRTLRVRLPKGKLDFGGARIGRDLRCRYPRSQEASAKDGLGQASSQTTPYAPSAGIHSTQSSAPTVEPQRYECVLTLRNRFTTCAAASMRVGQAYTIVSSSTRAEAISSLNRRVAMPWLPNCSQAVSLRSTRELLQHYQLSPLPAPPAYEYTRSLPHSSPRPSSDCPY